MIAYGCYLLKVSLCIIAFYSLYILALRKCTFFLINRLYLTTGLILSFIIPILKVSIFESQSTVVFPKLIYATSIEPEYSFFQPQNVANGITSINFPIILSVIYFAGISVLFFKLLFSIIKVFKLKKHAETFKFSKVKIVKMEAIVPFSFFNTIFLPLGENDPMIIDHEMAHIKQLHWFDLVLSEVASILLWFNPFVVLYKSSLKLQHEYLADLYVINNSNKIENYLGCMLKRIQIGSFDGLTSQFYCKTIKKRIVMITKNKTSVKYLGVYFLAIPLVCLLLFAFTSSNSKAILIPANKMVIGSDEYRPSIYPVDEKRISKSNGYGERMNPITKKKDFHYGIDLAISEGEQIMVTAKGIVIEAKFDTKQKKGNYIIVKHSDIYSTFYSHLKSISVKKGDKLERGQVIGYVGSTGVSTAPHLHYEVIKNGERVNPIEYMPK